MTSFSRPAPSFSLASLFALVLATTCLLATAVVGCGPVTEASCSCAAPGMPVDAPEQTKVEVLSGACMAGCGFGGCAHKVVEASSETTCTLRATPPGASEAEAETLTVKFTETSCCGYQSDVAVWKLGQ